MKTKKIFSALCMTALVFAGAACNNEPDAPKTPGNPGGGNNGGGDGGGSTTTEILTVTQAMAKQDNTEATVKGYIVGWFNTKPNPGECVFTNQAVADTTVNKANVLIAETADCTDATKVMCVQLPAGQVRTISNIGDNPENLGKELIVKGILTSYNLLPGVKTTSYAEINGKKSTDPISEFYCYRVGLGTMDAATVGALKVGDKVVINAKVINYKGTTPETVQKTGTFVSINGEAPADALTAAQAIAKAVELGTDIESPEAFNITGEVTKITENAATTHKNMTFYIK